MRGSALPQQGLRLGAVIAIACLLLVQAPAYAKKPGPFTKLKRGLKNMLLAPLDIPATVSRAAHEASPQYALTFGWFEGAGNMMMRFTSGFAEVVVFAFPRYDVPLYDRRLGENPLGPYHDKK